ncbi:FGGY-family carbohydrate kinase [Amaricoccus solimangrovi]|uniref:Carbohydrate kinase n=1 Tax=Amaricoccus solimangrovi TaxID=2589815 RepID=A0A501WUC1_9RHOB|nr:FGGY-family carbohydrate kinase [Amaricoccus solimangrovi]TPE53018.1 carbohydrate kinase [Amaricoccus solimangrovi]
MARKILVIDIGKTNAKLALVDLATRTEIATRSTPNTVLPGPPYPHADVERLWAFIIEGARSIGAAHRVDAITVTTHGATAALLCEDGSLALPILDYEFHGPDTLRADYDRARPPFAETGSPRLPLGLNLGAQLFWQTRNYPQAARATRLLPYPQYWAYRLSGVMATEATSLGCHTDLWAPRARGFSTLVRRQGWLPLMPPLRAASDRLAPILPAVARATGLDPRTAVHCGIHDSNASLLPHLRARPAPFAVVSTGTWVVSMAVGASPDGLDPARDTLINVDAFGAPVPSARFMGGREWEFLTAGRETEMREADRRAVLAGGLMLLPAVQPGSGPFQGRTARWSVPESRLADGERAVVVSYYLAMMTSVCLGEISAAGPILVEGPFARNPCYLAMLAAATGRPVLAPAAGGTGTSVGAALLAAGDGARGAPPREAEGPRPDPALAAYAAAWMARVSREPARAG